MKGCELSTIGTKFANGRTEAQNDYTIHTDMKPIYVENLLNNGCLVPKFTFLMNSL